MASYFLNSLARIHFNFSTTNTASSSSSLSLLIHRSRRIKRAAYASMVHAVGTRRAWSRALIYNLQRRRRARYSRCRYLPVTILQRGRRHRRNHRVLISRTTPSSSTETRSADVLRRLVPGGRGMDITSLLDETASYVQCLSAQVRIMQTVLDSFSS